MPIGSKAIAAAVAASAVAATVYATSTPAADAAAAPAPVEDFNGDGYADLATSAPGGTVGGQAGAGYVVVTYGSASGLNAASRTVLSQNTSGVPGGATADDRFGDRLAARDLDGDGLTDLAVTTPYEGSSGTVTILWGRTGGVTGQGAVTATVPGGSGQAGDLHGGDFDGDGNGDLLVPNGRGDAQAYSVLYGPFSRGGVPAGESPIIEMKPEDDVNGMAVGDVTGDGADDLVAFFSFQGNTEGGYFWKGGPGGLTLAGGLPNGGSATIGDFDKDGKGDIAYRKAGLSVENFPYEKGRVGVIYGTAQGPSETRRKTFTQDTAGVPGVGEDGDQFGARLDAGDANGDGYADLAVGVPYEAIGTKRAAGSAVLLKGGSGGLTATGAQAFNQDTAGVPGAAERGDQLGSALRLLDVTKDGKAELAFAAPGENANTGALWSLRGASGGLTASGSVAMGPVALGAPAAGALFGTTFSGEDDGHYLYTTD